MSSYILIYCIGLSDIFIYNIYLIISYFVAYWWIGLFFIYTIVLLRFEKTSVDLINISVNTTAYMDYLLFNVVDKRCFFLEHLYVLRIYTVIWEFHVSIDKVVVSYN